MLLVLFSVIALVAGVIYQWTRSQRQHFQKLGIEYDKATPLLGTFKNAFLRRENLIDAIETVYKKFDSGIVGIFDMTKKAFLIRSPEVVRQITIKDFDHFFNRRSFFVDRESCLFGSSLFQLDDQKWKDMRSSLSPAFTGSKMRAMFELIRDVGVGSINHLKDSKPTELNLRDFLSRYANDVIATTAFGFQINSNKDPHNEFFKIGEEVSNSGNLRLFFIASFKRISKILGLDVLTKKQTSYYMRLVMDCIKYRQDHDIFRQDMINMIMEIKGIGVQGNEVKKSSQHWSDVELVSQCFLFFFAGFDTVSTTLSFIGHELMENQDCQDKLRKEITEIAESLDGKPLTYEALQSMKYAEAVIYESMRKWPTPGFLDRICTKPITLQDPVTQKFINFKVGDNVQIPVVGIQRDPKYYPDPMRFNPERFIEENKRNVDPNTVLSFGIGPRMCIGNRFALLEMKSLLFHLFKEFKFERQDKSVVPLLKLDPSATQLQPEGGFWVKLSPV